MKKKNAMQLCRASVNDEEWLEIVPETVKILQEYLKTDQFAVLTSEELPFELVNFVVEGFSADQTLEVDDGYMLELGKYSRIPAAIFSHELEAMYFALSDEPLVLKILEEKWKYIEK